MKKTLLTFAGLVAAIALMAQATPLPFMEDFESATTIPATFMLKNLDGNSPASAPASLADSAFIVRNRTEFESNVAYGVSYYEPEGGADDWLILPKLALTANPVLSWKALSLTSSGNYPDTYQVLVSTTDTATASFTSIFEVEEEVSLAAGGPGPQSRTIDLKAEGYAGQEVYIAFRLMTPSPGGDRLAIDDIRVVDVLLEGFENGIPDSWTVIDGGTNPGTWFQDDYTSYKGNYCAGLDTWDGEGTVTDDWLITPKVRVEEGHELSFWARSSSTNYTEDLHILLSKGTDTVPDFTITIADISPVSPGEWGKYSFILSDHAEVSAGDMVHIGFWCDSEGSFLNLDEVRYGEVVPAKMMRVISISETAVDVVFDAELDAAPDASDFTLTGTAEVTFTGAELDASDKTLVHLTGATPAMAGDNTLDTLAKKGSDEMVEFYAGILPLSYTSLTHPGGTMDVDNHNATFKAIVMGINVDTSRVWFADAAGAHNGVNTYNLVTDGLALGDEVLFYGKLSPYQNQTEIYPGTQMSIVSSGNALFEATKVTGADIAFNITEDTDPAEQYEGVLIRVENVEVTSWDGAYFNCTDDGGENVFYVGNYDDLFDGFGETTLTVGNTYHITGFLVGRGAEYRIVPRNADDISDVTSVEDPPGKTLRIYPVPVSDILHVENAEGVDRLEISGISGQIVHSADVDGITFDIDMSRLQKGVYFLRLIGSEKETSVRKIIKK